MKKTVNYIICDMCKCQSESTKGWLQTGIPVVFHTEQNEGTGCEPYLDKNTLIDMCPECAKRFLEEYPIHARGAQGYNEFEWSKR